MLELLSQLDEIAKIIVEYEPFVILAVIIIVAIKIWLRLAHGCDVSAIKDYLLEHKNNVKTQNEIIIENQKRIIELLEKQCPEVDSSHDESQ